MKPKEKKGINNYRYFNPLKTLLIKQMDVLFDILGVIQDSTHD